MCPGCFLGYLERFVALKAAPSAIPTPVPIATPKAILFIMDPKAVPVMIPAIIPYVTALPSPLEGSCGLGLLVSSCTNSSIAHDSGSSLYLRSPLLVRHSGELLFLVISTERAFL